MNWNNSGIQNLERVLCYRSFEVCVESGYYFPPEFDEGFDFSCVGLPVIRSAGAVAQLKLTVEVIL